MVNDLSDYLKCVLYVGVASAHERLGRYNDAIIYCDKAIEIDPHYVDAWYSKGTNLAKLENYGEAIKCFDKAIEINSDHAGAWYNKGLMGGRGVDRFGVVKIFRDAPNPNFYEFQIGQWGRDSGDRDHFPGRTYGSCEGSNADDRRKSIISTEWEKEGREYINQEATGYFFLSEMDDGDKDDCYKFEQFGKGSSVSIKLRGSNHKNNNNSAKMLYL